MFLLIGFREEFPSCSFIGNRKVIVLSTDSIVAGKRKGERLTEYKWNDCSLYTREPPKVL